LVGVAVLALGLLPLGWEAWRHRSDPLMSRMGRSKSGEI
jgi:hypothetical protein